MIFLRHPTPDIDPRICYGQTDIGIAEIGHEQIEKALELTPTFTRLIASPALRCRKLAQCLAEREGITPTYDERLWEMNMGEFEGVEWEKLDREKSEIWLSDPVTNPTPGGESFAQVQQRALKAVSQADDDTAIVCHAGVIRAIQMAWEGITFKEAFAQTPPFAEPIILQSQDSNNA